MIKTILLRWRSLAACILLLCIALLSGCSTTSSLPSQAQLPEPRGPAHIALLLPLSGKLAANGQAIQRGILAAYYYARQYQTSKVTLTAYDTSQGDIRKLYQQAIDQGANLVIGPLTKQNLDLLVRSGKLTVPTLALNTIPSKRDIANLYQFSLSQQAEAVQVAQKAWSAGYRRALVIAPHGTWGKGIATALEQSWKQQGGQIVGTMAIGTQQQLSNQIRQLLEVNKSRSRTRALQGVLKENVQSVPQRRQDFDVIFLIAAPDKARQIRPLLKFYYAGKVPIYSTSLIYSGTKSKRYNQDLDGIRFTDMPWILNSANDLSPRLRAIRNRIVSLWPNSYQRNPRLYALGVDSYQLVTHFWQLSNGNDISGATGILQLASDGQIARKLEWARMQNGTPKLIT